MLKVYGSKLCPDCVACCSSLDQAHAEYEMINITDSMANLKEFLAIRDENPIFDRVRAAHSVGIPTLVLDDGTITYEYEDYLKEHGYPIVEPIRACSLDGKGC